MLDFNVDVLGLLVPPSIEVSTERDLVTVPVGVVVGPDHFTIDKDVGKLSAPVIDLPELEADS